MKLTARSLKCTLVISPEELAAVAPPTGAAPVPFVIEVGHRKVTGQFNAKSLRKAIGLAAQGIGKVVVIQGNLTETNTLDGAGISVPMPPPAAKAS